ncbi:MFS transporter [Halobacteriales archaeon QH_7_66_36]|nr:MAG: MFS transporter [Halobacteriales archaeon QH_7_66_36]
MNPNDRRIVSFTMLGHALFHTYELSIPVFVVAWLDAFSTTPATLGLAVGLGYGLVGLGALPAGILADTRESRELIVVSLLGMGVGFGLLAAAPGVVGIALALAVWGVAASLYHPAGLALLSRGTTERGAGFAYHGAAGNVGTALGPFVAALLLVFLDWRLVALAFVVPAIVGAVVAARVSFDETAAVESEETAMTDGGPATLRDLLGDSRRLFTGGFVLVFGVVMLYGLYYRGVLTFLPDLLADTSFLAPMTVGVTTFEPSRFVYAGLLVLGVFGQYAGGRLTDRFETDRLLAGVLAGLVAIALLFVPALEAGIVPLLGICAVLGFAVYATAPIYQATIADHVTADARGLSYGYTYLGMFGIGALGATLAGGLLTYTGTTTLFVVLAGLAAGALLLCLRVVTAH